MSADLPSAHSKWRETALELERARNALFNDNRRLREQLDAARSETAKWQQAFNSLEKPVTRYGPNG